MTGRQLIAWSARHDRRAHAGWWRGAPLAAILGGLAIAAWVAWRGSAGGAGFLVAPGPASHAWLTGTIAAFAIALLRVPFHVYWRADASLLAQLPIDGGALFDAALWRCARAARTTTIAALLGTAPLFAWSPELAARHAALACALGLGAALLLPSVAAGAAAMVAHGKTDQLVAALGGGEVQAPPTAVLGLLPGMASAALVIGAIAVAPWLGGSAEPAALPILGVIVAASALAVWSARASAPRFMALVLRDVSALDRQRLATLEIRPPTAIERAVAARLGAGAVAYRKDARLMRRRYPMAFALGGLAFLVLAIVGLARPDDPTPWLVATLAGAAAYGVALAGRLRRPPIELPRLTATLPIADAARARAKLAWVIAWWAVFVAVPAAFAALRQADPRVGLIALAVGTLAIVVGGSRR